MNKAAARKSLRPQTDKYRGIFLHSAVPLWEVDICELRGMIQGWRTRGIRDLRAYFDIHPGVLKKAIQSIKVVDV